MRVYNKNLIAGLMDYLTIKELHHDRDTIGLLIGHMVNHLGCTFYVLCRQVGRIQKTKWGF